jgi:hypothetical protein
LAHPLGAGADGALASAVDQGHQRADVPGAAGEQVVGFRLTDGIAHWVGGRWRGPEQLNPRVVFPHLDEFQPVMWDTLPELEEERFPTPADHADAVRQRAELVQTLKDREETDTYGTIPLSHHGCGYYDLLVVNGPDAGHIWFDGRAADGPISPHIDDSDRVTFDRWYLTWLADAEELCTAHALDQARTNSTPSHQRVGRPRPNNARSCRCECGIVVAQHSDSGLSILPVVAVLGCGAQFSLPARSQAM